MIRILVADDHELLRRGLRGLLVEAFPDATIGEAGDDLETLRVAGRDAWDIVLLDVNMPGRSGLEILQDLRRSDPHRPVLMLSAFPEEEYALRAFRLGAAGYVSKQGASSELLHAVRKVLSGGRYVTPSLAERLAAALAGEVSTDEPHQALSNRELQILRLIAQGHTLKAIASSLGLSEKTVSTYRVRISRKLGLGTNVELTRYAVQHRLVD
jgi:DNA-binding NarL/FixJ family response regulator